MDVDKKLQYVIKETQTYFLNRMQALAPSSPFAYTGKDKERPRKTIIVLLVDGDDKELEFRKETVKH